MFKLKLIYEKEIENVYLLYLCNTVFLIKSQDSLQCKREWVIVRNRPNYCQYIPGPSDHRLGDPHNYLAEVSPIVADIRTGRSYFQDSLSVVIAYATKRGKTIKKEREEESNYTRSAVFLPFPSIYSSVSPSFC